MTDIEPTLMAAPPKSPLGGFLLVAAGCALIGYNFYQAYQVASYQLLLLAGQILLALVIFAATLIVCLKTRRGPTLIQSFFLVSLLSPFACMFLSGMFVNRLVASVGPEAILEGARSLVAQEVAARAEDGEPAVHERVWSFIRSNDSRVPASLAQLGPSFLKVEKGYVYLKKDGMFGDWIGFKIDSAPHIVAGPVSWTSSSSRVAGDAGSGITTNSRAIAPGIAWISAASP